MISCALVTPKERDGHYGEARFSRATAARQSRALAPVSGIGRVGIRILQQARFAPARVAAGRREQRVTVGAGRGCPGRNLPSLKLGRPGETLSTSPSITPPVMASFEAFAARGLLQTPAATPTTSCAARSHDVARRAGGCAIRGPEAKPARLGIHPMPITPVLRQPDMPSPTKSSPRSHAVAE